MYKHIYSIKIQKEVPFMWHEMNIYEVLKEKNTDERIGLSTDEAKKRRIEYGLNKLNQKKKESLFIKFIKQFNDFMIKNNGKSWLSEVEKRNQTIAHSFLFCAKMKEFV